MTFGPMMLIALLGAHWFFDYAGQGDFMAKAKNPVAPIAGVPWADVLIAHAGIHGAAVALITGLWQMFVFEFLAHFVIDYIKCDGGMTFREDQCAHIFCKILWFSMAWGILT